MIQLPPLFRGSDHRRAATGVQSDASSFRRRPERPAGNDYSFGGARTKQRTQTSMRIGRTRPCATLGRGLKTLLIDRRFKASWGALVLLMPAEMAEKPPFLSEMNLQPWRARSHLALRRFLAAQRDGCRPLR